MSTGKTGTRYDEDFKRTLVNLYQSGGKSQAALCKEYGVSITALGRWIKQYSIVETDDGEILTAKQVKDLQKRNAQLEEELLILKKAIAIFTPHSNNDQKLFISSVSNTISSSFVRFLALIEVLTISITTPNRLIVQKTIKRLQSLFLKSMQIITNVLELTRLPMFSSVIMALTSVSDECTD